jgi:hypothetical protein
LISDAAPDHPAEIVWVNTLLSRVLMEPCSGIAGVEEMRPSRLVVNLVIALALLQIGAIASARAAVTSPFAPAIETLAEKLETEYIFPDVGAKYAKMLRDNLKSGAYAGIGDPAEISERITADLQAVAPDGHLRLKATGAPYTNPRKGESPAIRDEKWIEPDVAYISFGILPDDPKTVSAITEFLRDHASAKTLIIDAREDHGGGILSVDALFGYLYSARQIIGYMDENKAALTKDDLDSPNPPTIKEVPAAEGLVRYEHSIIPNATPTPLRSTKVFYLISHHTASAGEYMASILKRTGRATLVGERTEGDNHFGYYVPLGDGLSLFLPWGRISDPTTGEDWEGKGITPDIAVPADTALAEALRLAGAQGQLPTP